MTADPQVRLREWLPHVLTLAAMAGAVALFADVVAPLFEPILLAAAVAILTAPVLCQPLHGFFARRFPGLSPTARSRLAGIAATAALVLLAVAPLVFAVVSQAENLSDLVGKAKGVVMRDRATIQSIVDAVVAQVELINSHYKRLNLDVAAIRKTIEQFLLESSDVNTAFITFLSGGTVVVAQVALALVSLAYFNIDGPRLARAILAYAPLTTEQRLRIEDQHRRVVLRLLTDTVATAVVKGIVLGSIVYGVDHLFGPASLPFVPVATVAALITLLPLVGVTIVWLPFAGLAWSQGNHAGAIVLALACWTSNFFVDRTIGRLGNRLHERTDWLGFLLFLGVIGGLLSHGPKGLVIGPFAVVLLVTIGRAWLPLYVTGSGASEEGRAGDP